MNHASPRPARPALRRLVLGVDVEKYSSRSPQEQDRVQTRLRDAVAAACHRAGTDPRRCAWQPSGDGVLLLLPQGLDERRAAPGLVQGLADALHRDNGLRRGREPMRLRAALGQGAVAVADNGYVGEAVVAVSRHLDCAPLRQALARRPDRDLAVLVADDLYQDLRHDWDELGHFTRVRIEAAAKGFSGVGRVALPTPGSLLRPPVADLGSAGSAGPGSAAATAGTAALTGLAALAAFHEARAADAPHEGPSGWDNSHDWHPGWDEADVPGPQGDGHPHGFDSHDLHPQHDP